jgi:hypothetical protein
MMERYAVTSVAFGTQQIVIPAKDFGKAQSIRRKPVLQVVDAFLDSPPLQE